MIEDAKVHLLFEKVNNSGIQVQIEALKASITTVIDALYMTEANHISTSVWQFPEYSAQKRVISRVKARGTSDGIHNPNGSIISDKWIPNWSGLSIEDLKKIMDERKRLGIRIGKWRQRWKRWEFRWNNNKTKNSEKWKNWIANSKYRLRHWRGLTPTMIMIVKTTKESQWMRETVLGVTNTNKNRKITNDC